MTQQARSLHLKRLARSAATIAMVFTVMVAIPACSKPPKPVAENVKIMPSNQIDHSGMDGAKHMDGISMTGNVNYDFAANMRMHHQMAVDMSLTELKNGKNPQMIRMASDIIAAQNIEIATLDRWLDVSRKSAAGTMPKPQ